MQKVRCHTGSNSRYMWFKTFPHGTFLYHLKLLCLRGRGINLEGIIVLDDREKYREGKF